MLYSTNILSLIPADWSVLNGSMSEASIILNAGGSASLELDKTDLSTIPSSFKLNIVSDAYAEAYAADIYAVLLIEGTDNQVYEYSAPIVDTGNNICTIVISTTAIEFTSFTFTIKTQQNITISSWSLAIPDIDEVHISDVEQKISRLLYDFNTSTISVGQREEAVGVISAYLTENTDISGHFNMAFEASASCVITLRFKDNDGIELFAPLLYDVKVGRGTISVPHAYLNRLLGVHHFVVTARCSTGTIILHTRSVLYTIDAGYLATRLINIDTDLQDIALQQLSTDDEPSYIYGIGIDKDGIVRVRYRPYEDNADLVWEALYVLEEGIAAAIEFNGDFVRRIGNQFFTLECETEPWLFWVTSSGDLKAQHGSDTGTRVTLATGASSVCAVRGFKSNEYVAQDQGLIVAYLKSGTAYYRNYCRQDESTILWEEERVLTDLGTDLTSLNVHRLNDYRVGFVGSSPTANKWLISSRTYVAAAVPTEFVSITPTSYSTLAVVPSSITDYEVTLTPSVSEEDHTDLYVTCNYSLFNKKLLADCLEFSSSDSSVEVESYTITDNVLHIKINDWPSAARMYISFKKDLIVAYLDNCGYVRVPSSTLEFLILVYGYNEDSISVDLAATSSIVQKFLATLYAYSEETVVVALGASSNAIVQKYVTKNYGYHEETVVATLAATLTITESFVGTEPI